VRISKYKTVFDKGYLPNWTTEIFVISKILQTRPITYKIKDLSDTDIAGGFYEQELVLFNKQDDVFKVEKILRRRDGKALVKSHSYPDNFNQWIPETDFGVDARDAIGIIMPVS
jgi:hypothetical protein